MFTTTQYVIMKYAHKYVLIGIFPFGWNTLLQKSQSIAFLMRGKKQLVFTDLFCQKLFGLASTRRVVPTYASYECCFSVYATCQFKQLVRERRLHMRRRFCSSIRRTYTFFIRTHRLVYCCGFSYLWHFCLPNLPRHSLGYGQTHLTHLSVRIWLVRIGVYMCVCIDVWLSTNIFECETVCAFGLYFLINGILIL